MFLCSFRTYEPLCLSLIICYNQQLIIESNSTVQCMPESTSTCQFFFQRKSDVLFKYILVECLTIFSGRLLSADPSCLVLFLSIFKLQTFVWLLPLGYFENMSRCTLLLREMGDFTGGSRKSCRIGSCDDS
jgi:hypothetical protein